MENRAPRPLAQPSRGVRGVLRCSRSACRSRTAWLYLCARESFRSPPPPPPPSSAPSSAAGASAAGAAAPSINVELDRARAFAAIASVDSSYTSPASSDAVACTPVGSSSKSWNRWSFAFAAELALASRPQLTTAFTESTSERRRAALRGAAPSGGVALPSSAADAAPSSSSSAPSNRGDGSSWRMNACHSPSPTFSVTALS